MEQVRDCFLCGKPASNRRKRCGPCNTKIRRYRAKQAAIKLLGGKCKKCGVVGPQEIFDFHHINGKDFLVGKAANKSWNVIKKELEKCILLCSNCHRMEHTTRCNDSFLAEVAKYNGELLK